MIIVLTGLVCGVIWWWNASSDQSIAEALCRDIASGIEGGEASSLVDLLCDDYDIDKHWPVIPSLAKQLPGQLPEDRHELARKLLIQYFFTRRGQDRQVRCELDSLRPVDGGSVTPPHLGHPIDADLEATITLSISGAGREMLPATILTFWLRRDGALSLGARIAAHELVSTSRIR